MLIYVWNQPVYVWNSKVSHQMKLVKAQIWLSRDFPAEGPLKGKDGRSQVTQLYQIAISSSYCTWTYVSTPTHTPQHISANQALPGNNAFSKLFSNLNHYLVSAGSAFSRVHVRLHYY